MNEMFENLYAFVAMPDDVQIDHPGSVLTQNLDVAVDRLQNPTDLDLEARGQFSFGRRYHHYFKITLEMITMTKSEAPLRRALEGFFITEQISA